MARDFSKVSPQIWDSGRFKSLPDDSAKLAYLYLVSNGHQNSIGCYRLPIAYACADMGWPTSKFEAALAALVAGGLVETDGQTKEVLIPRWFKHNPPTNNKHAQGAFRLVEKIESASLRDAAMEALNTAWVKWQDEHPPGGIAPSPTRSPLLETPRMRALAGGRGQ